MTRLTATPLTAVTGGSRGIGAAICIRLASEGHDVVIGYRADRESAETVAAQVRDVGQRALVAQIDTADAASVDAFFDEADAFGTVTGFVNNAAMSGPVGNLADADVEQLRRAVDVNFFGYVLCARRAIRSLAAAGRAGRDGDSSDGDGGGGAIVNISSAGALSGSPGTYVHYAASKSAIDTLTIGLSKELASQGIRVNAVAPGIVVSEFHVDPERPTKLAPTIPFGRPGQPSEIAGAVAWLLSDDAGYTSGTILRVAGGL